MAEGPDVRNGEIAADRGIRRRKRLRVTGAGAGAEVLVDDVACHVLTPPATHADGQSALHLGQRGRPFLD